MTGALREAAVPADADRAVVIGAGGTSLPTIAALADWGVHEVTISARSAARASGAVDLARRLGLACTVVGFEDGPPLASAAADADVVISTVPATATAPVLASLRASRRLIDVIYDPWPTPLASAVNEAGGIVVGGLVMLLNQAYSQVEQFTGRPAPRAAMATALT